MVGVEFSQVNQVFDLFEYNFIVSGSRYESWVYEHCLEETKDKSNNEHRENQVASEMLGSNFVIQTIMHQKAVPEKMPAKNGDLGIGLSSSR